MNSKRLAYIRMRFTCKTLKRDIEIRNWKNTKIKAYSSGKNAHQIVVAVIHGRARLAFTCSTGVLQDVAATTVLDSAKRETKNQRTREEKIHPQTFSFRSCW